MKATERGYHCPVIQDEDFMGAFGMTSDEILETMTLPLPYSSSVIPRDDFVNTFGMLPSEFSRDVGIPMRNIEKSITEMADEMKCSPDCVIKLAKMLGASDAFLLNLTVRARRI
jgi:plasmid maintenance system antidote protein VapI